MSPIRKYGIIGAVLVLVAAFGGSLLTASQVGAVPVGAPVVSSSSAAAAPASTTVTAAYLDDSPSGTSAVLTFTSSAGASGYWTAGSCAVSASVGTVTVATPTSAATAAATGTCTAPDDTDTVAEGAVITAVFNCVTNGTFTFSLSEGGITFIGATFTCGLTLIPENIVGPRVAIGGASPDCGGIWFAGCVTNRSNVEIVPAPGSDNDARIDLRVRNAADSSVPGAHVHFIVTNGTITVGNGTGVPGVASDESVAEPSSAIFGASDSLGRTDTGDTCEPPAAPNAFLPQQADGFTNSSGIISACYFASYPGFVSATPGTATVTVLVDIPTVTALTTTVTITVVGPPASMTVAASPTSLRCGEKSTITVTVKDSVGQNVSDHSFVSFVTNFGGVVAGGSPFLGTSLVAPLSSGAAETFAGVATAFLLTSENHSGPYEVVATAGGSFAGGIFSTPPISAQVTVTCTIPAAVAPTAAATVRAPSTGEGASVIPPNTGDGGLAGGSGSSPLVLALSGIATLALAGFATLKVARR